MQTTVPFEGIEAGDNYRQDLGDLAPLIASIRQVGLLQNLVVTNSGDRHRLLGGYRRFAAMEALHQADELPDSLREAVPVFVAPEGCDLTEALFLAHAENMHLKPPILDEALLFQQLKGTLGKGATQTIADRTGYTVRLVQQRLRIARLPAALHPAIRSGEISVEVARVLSGKMPAEVVEALAARPEGIRLIGYHCATSGDNWYFISQAAVLLGYPQIPHHLREVYAGPRWAAYALDPTALASAEKEDARRRSAAQEASGISTSATEPSAGDVVKPPYTKLHLLNARQERTRYLQWKLSESPATLARVLVFYLANRGDYLFGDSGVKRLHPEPLLKELVHLVGTKVQGAEGHLNVAYSQPFNLSALLASSDADIEQLIRLLTLSGIANRGGYDDAVRDDRPETLYLAQALGVERVEDFALDDAWLKGYRKPGLLDVGVASKAFPENERRSLANETMAKIRRRILDSPSRDPHWVPEELTFPKPKKGS